MMKFTVRELMIQKGLKPSARRLTRAGIGYETARKLIDNRAKSIKLEDMTKLCFYLKCTPRELFGIDASNLEIQEGHPLEEWIIKDIAYPVQELMTMTPMELKLTQEYIRKIRNKEELQGEE
ncbi:helix-turn-helix domain-containing protein [Flavobacterium soli]|uniref:helix-turn-helix domain-containing protein n=1 Tax=Flavobacterium soli TaxID=344881 RepID=UPI000413FAA5|nr:helix-turn-helix transcriptional regulator [Flavobacterium soli]